MSENGVSRFPTTHWSGVERAGQQNMLGRAALADLLARYLPPLRAHLVRSRRLPPDMADDLLQTFISDRVLEQGLLACAAHEKGRFRTFLLVALNRFVSNELRNAKRQCRSPGNEIAVLDAANAIDPDPSPCDAFEIAWAREVLTQAAERMRDSCLGSGRTDVWRVFEGRVLFPTIQGAQPTPYEQLVVEFSLSSVHAASNLLITAKRMFARSLRGVVGEYTGEDGQIDQEIADLRAILSRGP